MISMTSPLRATVGIACPTALLLRVHHRVFALLELIPDSVSWHLCDTFFGCSWTTVAAMWMTLATFSDKPVVRKRKHPA